MPFLMANKMQIQCHIYSEHGTVPYASYSSAALALLLSDTPLDIPEEAMQMIERLK